MRLSIQGAGSNSFTMQQGTLRGLRLAFSATTVGDITTAVIQSVNINVQLQRAGQTFQIMSGNLFALGLAYNPSSYESIAIGSQKSWKLDFGGVIQVREGDNLQVTVNVGTAVTGGNVTCSTDDCVGIEQYTPTVTIFTIDPNKDNYSLNLGNNVSVISFVNTTTDYRLNSVTFSSNYWNTDLTARDFTVDLANEWERAPENYTFRFYNDVPIDNVQANLNVNTGATSTGYLVVFGGVITPETVARSEQSLKKVVQRNAAKMS